MEKLNLTQQKHAFTNEKKCTTTQNKHKRLKPGLVVSYNIQPGNGEGLFLFCHFINLLTALGSTRCVFEGRPVFDKYILVNHIRLNSAHDIRNF